MALPSTPKCNEPTCSSRAHSLVYTRQLGRLARDGTETRIIWDIDDTPAKGWGGATPVCSEHRDELLLALGKVLG